MAEKKSGKKVTITMKKGQKGTGKKAAPKPAAEKKEFFGLADLPDELADRGRDIWLAGLGALSAVEEEGVKVFASLVKKGEAWEETSRKKLGAAKSRLDATRGSLESTVERVAEQSEHAARSLDDRLLAAIEDAVEGGLQRLGVPSRAEVKDLAGKVEKLAEKVATLASVIEQRQAPAAPAARGRQAVYHVVPHEAGWAVKQEGTARPVSTHGTKAEARDAARSLAQAQAPSRLVLHKQDGTIQTSHTYDA